MTATRLPPQELIERYQDLVRSIALSVRRKVPRTIELEDLIAYGQIGLAEAAKDFDPHRGNAFSTYAYYRIRGAIYDGVSKLCWTSRSRYHRMREQQAQNQAGSVQPGPTSPAPTATTLAQETRHRVDRASTRMIRVYLATCTDDDASRSDMSVPDPNAQPPSEVAANHEACRQLRRFVDTLPSREAQLIRSVYFEGKNLQQAGSDLGISKSWASRIHAKALEHLARSLRNHGFTG